MESEEMLTYKWEGGIYSLQDIVILVKYKQITPEKFFEITRYNYAAVVQKMKNLD